MTTFAQENQVREQTNMDNLRVYNELTTDVDSIELQVIKWFDVGVALHAKLSDSDQKAEVLALRQSLIDRLKIALGL